MAADEYDYYGFRPYVPVRARRAQAARALAKLEKRGYQTSPVTIEGRKIAQTFWGGAWCDNLERYSDFANRLPRGRTYVRNGSVVDLQIAPGNVTALVSGSAMYDVTVTVAPVARARWSAICQDCAGAIDSLVELLQGRFSKGVMTRLCETKRGLFPSPKDIIFTCSCPDWASMCKHVAAVLYGVGARLDRQPELLFTLRQVNHQDLIAKAGSGFSKPRKGPAGAKVLEGDDLAGMFGIEMAPPSVAAAAAAPPPPPPPPPRRAAAHKHATRPPASRVRPKPTIAVNLNDAAKPNAAALAKPSNLRPPAPKRPAWKRMTPTMRRAVAERMKKYWAARRAAVRKRQGPKSS